MMQDQLIGNTVAFEISERRNPTVLCLHYRIKVFLCLHYQIKVFLSFGFIVGVKGSIIRAGLIVRGKGLSKCSFLL